MCVLSVQEHNNESIKILINANGMDFHHFCIFVFYIETQDRPPKQWKKDLKKNNKMGRCLCIYPLWTIFFIQIALHQTISRISAFLRFMQKITLVAKNSKNVFFLRQMFVQDECVCVM